MMKVRSLRYRLTVLHLALLTGCLSLLCLSVYFGVRHYLDADLHFFLSGQSHAIAEKLLANVKERGEAHVAGEMNEQYAPEISGEFIRITRQDGSVLYQSASDRKAFDPDVIVPVRGLLTREVFKEVTKGYSHVAVNAYPFWTADGVYYLIEVGASHRPTTAILNPLAIHLALGTVLIILSGIAAGYWLTGRALRPVNSLTEQAEKISYLTINQRLPVMASGDEIERLAIALNRMIGRLDDAFRHIEQFSADVSHELRTPLTIVQAELEHMGQLDISAELYDIAGSALEETARLTRIIDHLLELSRIDSGGTKNRSMVNLGDLTVSTADQMRLLADEKAISLIYDIAPDIKIEGDPVRLRQVVANLLDNAIKYTPPNGWVRLHVEGGGQHAVLRIVDSGIGIAPESVPHIFDRFYRVDWARSRNLGGAGLGLSLVKAICTAHDAEIGVVSEVGKGSCFRVEFKGMLVSKKGSFALSVQVKK